MYAPPNNIMTLKLRNMSWSGHVALMGEMKNAYGVMAVNPNGNSPVGKPRRKRDDNRNMGLCRNRAWSMDWIRMAHYRD